MAGDLRPVRLAGIDIGTNTVLMLVAEVDARGELTTIADLQETPRLGRDVDAAGKIREAAFGTLAGILIRYREAALSHGASRIAACATSALRNASNREELVMHVREATGIGIEVIDGKEEAGLMFLGVTGGRGAHRGGAESSRTAVLDIGGGSTELCYEKAGGGIAGISMEIGSVRLTERYFRHAPPLPEEIREARAGILPAFSAVDVSGLAGCSLVAVAGTAVTLAAIHLGLREFRREMLEGCTIGARALQEMSVRLLAMHPESIRSLSGLTAGREDVLGAGALIFSAFTEQFGFGEAVVSTRGLRYGIVLREWERMGKA